MDKQTVILCATKYYVIFYLFFSRFIEILLTYNICKFKMYNVIWSCIYYKMITTIRLVNTFILSHNYLLCVCVVITSKIYFLNNFQVYDTVLLIIITMLYIRSPEHTCLVAGSLYPLTNISPSLPPLASGNHRSTLYFFEFSFFRFHI